MNELLDLFSTRGRANRSWYFWHILLDDVAMLTAGIGLMVLAVVTGFLPLLLPAAGVFVAGMWAGICITTKRLHDLERPSWHWWLLFVPLYNIYLGLVLLFQKGTAGPNSFGNDPLAGGKALPR